MAGKTNKSKKTETPVDEKETVKSKKTGIDFDDADEAESEDSGTENQPGGEIPQDISPENKTRGGEEIPAGGWRTGINPFENPTEDQAPTVEHLKKVFSAERLQQLWNEEQIMLDDDCVILFNLGACTPEELKIHRDLNDWKDGKNMMDDPEFKAGYEQVKDAFSEERFRELWNQGHIGFNPGNDQVFLIAYSSITEEENQKMEELFNAGNRQEAQAVVESVLGKPRASELFNSNGIVIDEKGNVKVDRALVQNHEFDSLTNEHVQYPSGFESFNGVLSNGEESKKEAEKFPADDEQPEANPENYTKSRRV